MDAIHAHVETVAAALIERLVDLRHANGRHLVTLYDPPTMDRRGATLAFNFVGPDGQHLDPRVVERPANQQRISLRTGCFCNPGVGEVSQSLSKPELEACFLSSPHRMSAGVDTNYGRLLVRAGLVVIPRHVPAPLPKPAPPSDIR